MRHIVSLCARYRAPLGALAAVLLGACNPSLNWRETRIADTELAAMMPCKPAHHQRSVPLAGLTVTMHMTACDADGATFAVAHAVIPNSSAAPALLAEWRKTTLANMAATSVREARDTVESPAPTPTSPGSSMLTLAQGRRGDGTPVILQGVWFARGSQVFHAAVYAPVHAPVHAPEQAASVTTTSTEPFFSGLKFQ